VRLSFEENNVLFLLFAASLLGLLLEHEDGGFTSLRNICQTTRRHIPEDDILSLLCVAVHVTALSWSHNERYTASE
jgi:UPF0716 family protein affecting phage T7 exclusion